MNARFFIFLLAMYSCKEPTTKSKGDLKGFTITALDGNISKAALITSSGVLKEDGLLCQGEKSGSWATYQNDGKIHAQTSYINGKKNGSYLEFSERGTIEFVAHYLNDQLHGTSSWYHTGILMKQITYDRGKLNGKFREYFISGRLQKEANYKNGNLDGNLTYYDEQANIVLQYSYSNGQRTGGGIVDEKNAPQ